MRRIHPRGAVAVAAAALLLFPACTQDGTAKVTTDASPTSTETGVDLAAKPEFEVPSDEQPPAELVVEPLVEGEGRPARIGDTVTVHYVGKVWSTGEQFAASWDRDQPFSFELGAGRHIEGWQRGIEGMRVGGRRMLVIPPDLAYGPTGASGGIGPDETLVFVVDLLEVS